MTERAKPKANSRDKGRRVLAWLPDYDIAEDGEVRRITKAAFGPKPPYVINGTITPARFITRYRRVRLILPDGTNKAFALHRLVCEAFHGPAPSAAHQAAHWDGDGLNNHASNLRWATPKENADDRGRHGHTAEGERNGSSKLTHASVAIIRAKYSGRRGDLSRLAREFGVTRKAIAFVVTGEVWRNV